MRSAPAIAFDYRPSRWLLSMEALIVVLAVVSIVLSGLPSLAQLALIPLTLISSGIALYRQLHPKFARIAHGEAGWRLIDVEGNETSAELVDHLRRGSLLVLTLKSSGSGLVRFVFAPDNIDQETRRRLMLTLAASVPKTQSPH
jgi:toxin CptA